ncbi:hypothetical protein DLAC_10768 [Tieghemostelium lacteum]|uniref:Uncharacterized protein n=1 Tax=Tieghemostelium lacteum TaxID=361077 RepID=A0A151Z451_TIELA|nr:hypothetical protein DLAC_10768 [Tieghemostelium lacteum]|eukprot:KYQ88740.1 hypothetical protein DLAC_10768 [Tieghemostelium lacteum]
MSTPTDNTLIMHLPQSTKKVDIMDINDLELQFQNDKLEQFSNSNSVNNSPPDNNKMVFDPNSMQWKGNEDELDIFEDIDNL